MVFENVFDETFSETFSGTIFLLSKKNVFWNDISGLEGKTFSGTIFLISKENVSCKRFRGYVFEQTFSKTFFGNFSGNGGDDISDEGRGKAFREIVFGEKNIVTIPTVTTCLTVFSSPKDRSRKVEKSKDRSKPPAELTLPKAERNRRRSSVLASRWPLESNKVSLTRIGRIVGKLDRHRHERRVTSTSPPYDVKRFVTSRIAEIVLSSFCWVLFV